MKRIICVGNRHSAADAAGPLVYERLARMERPLDIEVIDGALAGLDLLDKAGFKNVDSDVLILP